MDMGHIINTPPPPPHMFGNGNKINPEEKEPILMDDDDVLRWNNDYGSNPLYRKQKLLLVKGNLLLVRRDNVDGFWLIKVMFCMAIFVDICM